MHFGRLQIFCNFFGKMCNRPLDIGKLLQVQGGPDLPEWQAGNVGYWPAQAKFLLAHLPVEKTMESPFTSSGPTLTAASFPES